MDKKTDIAERQREAEAALEQKDELIRTLIKENEKQRETIRKLVETMDKGLKILKKYKKLEDARKQGLLLRLPCTVGDTVYCFTNIDNEIQVQEHKICTLTNVVAIMENGGFGKTVFLTRQEAEQALEKRSK